MSTSDTAIKPFVVTPEEALSIKPFGLDMQVLLTTENTGGAISIIIGCHKPGEGPPVHLHYTQEECIFILEGSYAVTVGDINRTVGPGTILFIPRGVIHGFKNVGTTIGRMLDWTLPGGQDHYFRTICDLAASDGFTGEKAMEISKKFDTNFSAAH